MHPKARVVVPRLPLLLPARKAGVPVRGTGEVRRGLKTAKLRGLWHRREESQMPWVMSTAAIDDGNLRVRKDKLPGVGVQRI